MRERLTVLIYTLMMEHNVSPGTLETIVNTVEKEGFEPTYAQRDLAKYAAKLAERLVPPIKRNTEAARKARYNIGEMDQQQ